jgi:hypothetical protein
VEVKHFTKNIRPAASFPICVLHFIPNGMKLRGHLGSEQQRKAAAILSVEKG